MSEAQNSTVTTIEADFEKLLPALSVANSLANTYAGNIYRQVAGSVENVASWTIDHPAVTQSAEAIAGLVPGLSSVIPFANLAEHILGALGTLMASDPTVKGPQPPASVPTLQPATPT